MLSVAIPWGGCVSLPQMPESPYVTALKREIAAALDDWQRAVAPYLPIQRHD